MYLAELLSFYKFPGDEIPIIRGSALSALQGTNEEIGKKAILKLMDAVDEYIPDPVRQLDKPFLMPIEDVFSIQVKVQPFSINCLAFLWGRELHFSKKESYYFTHSQYESLFCPFLNLHEECIKAVMDYIFFSALIF